MTVPDYQSLMLPLLKAVSDGKDHDMTDMTLGLANAFHLSVEDMKEMLPSGKQGKFENRVGWARTYLKKAGLLERPGVGKVKITKRGLDLLATNPSKIDRKFLLQYPEFVEFQRHSEPSIHDYTDKSTPTDVFEETYGQLRTALAYELLETIKQRPPTFFEKLALDLLFAMGYGGTRQDVERVGRSGDGGIDGTINEDKLGLDVVYVQAKRWDQGTVGRKELQAFAGSLDFRRAGKGVFITTSRFTNEALEYAKGVDKKIVLIDGDKLAQLMIEYDVGVTKGNTYVLKNVDQEYFSGEA